MKKYRVIAFDLDGTLTDPASGLIAGFKYALDAYGIDYGNEESLKKFIGPPLQDAWEELERVQLQFSQKALGLKVVKSA